MLFEWQLERNNGEWVSQKFEKGKMPSTKEYKKAILLSTQPLDEVLTFVIVRPSFGDSFNYWSVQTV